MGAEIDRLEIAVETQASKANQQLDLMIKNLNKAAFAINGINLNKFKNFSKTVNSAGQSSKDSADKTNRFSSSMATLALHTGSSNTKLKSFTSTLSHYISKTIMATNKSKSLSQIWGSFYASFFPVIRGMKVLGRSIESSMDYIETFNYFNVTMDKIGKEFSNQYDRFGYDSADAYVSSFSGRLNDLTKKMTGFKVGGNGVLSLTKDMNLGLDPNAIMNYQASIAAITNSVGLIGETSVNTSKALSMLAADLSSFKNVNLNTVMTNMQSGLIGQSRALYKYGIDITNATLQIYAYKYGLSTAVSEMTQADKMQLRLLAILDQSKVAWGDQANTINSVANQYRIMKQQIQNVARMVGNILMPVIKAVLPFINGLLIATQRLLGFVGGLLGIDFGKIMDGISSGYSGFDAGDIADDTGDVADNYDKANKNAKKLQRTILGFDQINKLNDDSSESGSGADGGAGGIDLSNEIAAAIADYETVWNEAFQKSVNQAQVYADKICKVFNNMWGMIKRGDYEGLGEYIAGGVDSVFQKINSVFNWDKMGPGITGFVNGYTRTVNSLVSNIDWQNIGKTMGDGFNVLTSTMYLYLTGIDWVNLGTALADGLNGMVNSVNWGILGRTIGAWIMKIPKMVYGFVTTLDWSAVGTGVGTALNGSLVEFDGKMIAEGINGIVNGILDALKAFIKTVDWSEVARAVGDVLGNLDWGTLAKVGLVIGAAKLAGAFGKLLKTTLSDMIENKAKSIFGGMFSNIGSVVSKLFGDDGIISSSIATFGVKISSCISSLTGISVPANVAFAGIVAGIALIVGGIIDLWNTSETFRDNVQNMLSIIGEAFGYAKEQIWDNGLKPLWDNIKELFGSLYEIYESSGLKEIFEDVVTALGYVASVALSGLIVAIGEFVKFLANMIGAAVDVLKIALTFVKEFFRQHQDTIDGLKQIFHGLTEFLAGAFSGDWSRAWNGIKQGFKGIWDTFVSIVRTPVNKILSIIENMINSIIVGFNGLKRMLNHLKINVPKGVPLIGGTKLGFNFDMTSTVNLPRLAKGGLVDNGQLFLARERGPELVGMHKGKSAVMNNDQLVDSVTDSLREAFTDVAVRVAMLTNVNQSETQPLVANITIKTQDDEILARAVYRGNAKLKRRGNLPDGYAY